MKRAKIIITKIKKSWKDLKANYIWLKREIGNWKNSEKNNPVEKKSKHMVKRARVHYEVQHITGLLKRRGQSIKEMITNNFLK